MTHVTEGVYTYKPGDKELELFFRVHIDSGPAGPYQPGNYHLYIAGSEVRMRDNDGGHDVSVNDYCEEQGIPFRVSAERRE